MSFAKQTIIKFFIALMVASHVFACLWGMLGRFYITISCDGSDFLEFDHPPHVTSWIIAIYNGKSSPIEPCNPYVLYLWSLHWSVMSITSIGYGDIVPTHSPEYVLCVIAMLTGSIMWAYIIGSVCGVVSNLDPFTTIFRQSYDNLNYMLDDHKIGTNVKLRCREYHRESKHIDRITSYRLLNETMSKPLCGELTLQTYYEIIAKVNIFKRCTRMFIVECCRLL